MASALLGVLLLAGCGADGDGAGAKAREAAGADSAVSVVDDAGRTVALPGPARRIVSLIPSATDLVVAMGARDRLVGRTDFDDAAEVAQLPSVGGGLDPSLETLVSLKPDLVLSWETGAGGALRDRLAAVGIASFALEANDTADVFRAVASLGRLTGRARAADSLAASIRGELEAVRRSVEGRPRPSVLYVAWVDPPMVPGKETFIAQLLSTAGGEPLFQDARGEWPQVSMEEIVRRQPEVVVIPTGEGAQFSAAALRGAPGWRELKAFASGRVVEVPVEVVNRPGPNLGRAAALMRDAVHPELKRP